MNIKSIIQFLLVFLFSGSNNKPTIKSDVNFNLSTHQNGTTGKFGFGCESGDEKLPERKL